MKPLLIFFYEKIYKLIFNEQDFAECFNQVLCFNHYWIIELIIKH